MTFPIDGSPDGGYPTASELHRGRERRLANDAEPTDQARATRLLRDAEARLRCDYGTRGMQDPERLAAEALREAALAADLPGVPDPAQIFARRRARAEVLLRDAISELPHESPGPELVYGATANSMARGALERAIRRTGPRSHRP